MLCLGNERWEGRVPGTEAISINLPECFGDYFVGLIICPSNKDLTSAARMSPLCRGGSTGCADRHCKTLHLSCQTLNRPSCPTRQVCLASSTFCNLALLDPSTHQASQDDPTSLRFCCPDLGMDEEVLYAMDRIRLDQEPVQYLPFRPTIQPGVPGAP